MTEARASVGAASISRSLSWIIPGAACLAALSLAAWLARRDAVITASSTTGRYTLVYLAENLLDGAPASMWAPEPVVAWVDVDLRGARHLEWVAVTNGDNAPHHDASTRDFRVELYDAARRTFVASERFDSISTETRRIETDGARADRIRVVIDTWHGGRGCLADIDWHAR